MRLILCLSAFLILSARAGAHTVFVRAGGTGSGTRAAPVGSGAAAEAVARRGDRIVVLASPRVLQGQFKLKPRQRLIGRGAPRIASGTGDVVTLARRTTVRGLHIALAGRGGIYGRNVGRVRLIGNDVTKQNTSCTGGFLIPPFSVPTTVPGVGVPISGGLQNGWAGIMVDADHGTRRVLIRGNRVHDADCGDGIDVRAFKTARMRVRIAHNNVAELRQGTSLQSVLAIGLQTSDHARMTARLVRNRESGLGNDSDPGVAAAGADSEGVFVNPTGASYLRATITHETYQHVPGRSGFSANGLEFVSMGEGSTGIVTVRDSSFAGTPGDVIEQLALGTKGRLDLTLDHVVAKDSTGNAGTGEGNTVLIPGNNGDCVIGASGGAGNSVALTVRNSTLTNCANNGLTFGSSVSNGSGATSSLTLDVADSTITHNQGNNLRIGNVSDLDRLTVRVQDTDLSAARGIGSLTPADASFENIGSTAKATIDLGGGALGSDGGNCLAGGTLGAALVRYDVSAKHDWWGGPVSATSAGGTLASDPVLTAAPAACRS